MDTGAPLTPDFDTYLTSPPASASLHDGFVDVVWDDGTDVRCYSLWLAENMDGLGLDPVTRESIIDPSDLPHRTALRRVEVSDDGHLELHWLLADGAEVVGAVHSGWLRHVAEGRHRPSAGMPEVEMWTTETFTEPPTCDGRRILDDDDALLEWLISLRRFGLARLENTPASEDFMERLGRRLGPIRGSNFGEVFSVRAVIDPDSTANTGFNLGQHTDLPTRETPPGFQFLHCVRNEVSGGDSRMTDGHAVVAELRRTHPDHFEALTTLRWVFDNRSPSDDHRWTGPVIDHVDDGFPLTIRAFYPVRGFPDMHPDDVPRAYRAMRAFSRIAHDPRFQITYSFRPGDLVGFDNRRVLHGRDQFDSGAGVRHLQGCYLDQDDVYSTLRVLLRRRASSGGAGTPGTESGGASPRRESEQGASRA